jgi:hypothetical protein
MDNVASSIKNRHFAITPIYLYMMRQNASHYLVIQSTVAIMLAKYWDVDMLLFSSFVVS